MKPWTEVPHLSTLQLKVPCPKLLPSASTFIQTARIRIAAHRKLKSSTLLLCRLLEAMSDVSALTLPVPSECFGVFLAWISGGTDGATSRAKELSRTAPAVQTCNPSATLLDNTLQKIFRRPLRCFASCSCRRVHVQPETDCCTVCAVANLVTSKHDIGDASLVLCWWHPHNHRDIGLWPFLFVSVQQLLQSPAMRLLESPTASLIFFQMLPNPRRNMVAFIETTLLRHITFFVVHLRASSDGITKVWGDVILAQPNHNCSKMMVSSLIAWRSIQILERSEYDEAPA